MSRITLSAIPCAVPEPQPQLAERILVVDDNEANRMMLARRLEHEGYTVTLATNGAEALVLLRQTPCDLVLLDVMMPVMDGYETLSHIAADQLLRDIPTIMITAVDDVDSVASCIELGAEDYLHKPFNPTILRARVRSSLERKRLLAAERSRHHDVAAQNQALMVQVHDQLEAIFSAQLAAIFAMSKLAESRDPETGGHLERLREYCALIADELATSAPYTQVVDQAFRANLCAASPLHDIGKVGIPDAILLKPGKLSPEEWAVMKQHPLIGGMTLRAVDEQYPGNDFIRFGIEIAEGHHERWDGCGYPRGLQGEQVPLSATILALADVYDALTTRRCYRDALSHQDSRQIIVEERGRQFAPAIVDAFMAVEQEFVRVHQHYTSDDDAAA